MNDKVARILGMLVFSSITIFLFWHVDFSDLNYRPIIEFRYGNGIRDSLIIGLIHLFYIDWFFDLLLRPICGYRCFTDADYIVWQITHIIPFIVSWKIRDFLGKTVNKFYMSI